MNALVDILGGLHSGRPARANPKPTPKPEPTPAEKAAKEAHARYEQSLKESRPWGHQLTAEERAARRRK